MNSDKNTFTDTEIENFKNFGRTLLKIHDRLVKEGKIRKDDQGNVVFLEDLDKKPE